MIFEEDNLHCQKVPFHSLQIATFCDSNRLLTSSYHENGYTPEHVSFRGGAIAILEKEKALAHMECCWSALHLASEIA